MKGQQKRKIQQFHPENEDGTDLRRLPPRSLSLLYKLKHYYCLKQARTTIEVNWLEPLI